MNDNYAIVVAHPDDEILFASSILEKATQVFICFSDIPVEEEIHSTITKGRRNVKKRYPLKNVTFLDVPQASNKDAKKIDWDRASENEYGVSGDKNENDYKANFQKLFKILSSELVHFKKIYTHNPWGEYGHVEHIQIHRCIEKLSKILEFKMFVFGYLSRETLKMANKKINTLKEFPIKKKNNIKLFNEIKDLYIQEECWTWSNYHSPPLFEFFYEFKRKNNFLEISKLNKRKLIYIYHPIYSRRIRCHVYDTSSYLFKIFIIQNKYLFRIRTLILNTFLKPLIHKISN